MSVCVLERESVWVGKVLGDEEVEFWWEAC
jgi:hypothetical protein